MDKGLVMPRNCKHPEEAWKFIEFICGERGQTLTIEGGDCCPTLKHVAKGVFLTDPGDPRETQNQLYLDSVSYAYPIPKTIGLDLEIIKILGDEIELMHLRKQTPEETAKRITKKVNDFLTKKQETYGLK